MDLGNLQLVEDAHGSGSEGARVGESVQRDD